MVTEGPVCPLQNAGWEVAMPILIMALLALAIFGLIGLMLFTASTLERHQPRKAPTASPSAKRTS